MGLSNMNLKKVRMLVVLILSIMLFTSMVFVASAATAFDIQDPEGKYTFKITFPNGEGLEYEPGYHVENRGDYVKISIEEPWDHQNTVDVKIEVEGVDIKEWELFEKGYPIKRNYETNNEFALHFSSGCTQLQYCGQFYTVHLLSKAPNGGANLPFILVAAADETDDFFTVPAYEEIECGETIDFTLKKERNGIYSDVDDNEVEWIVAKSESVNPFISGQIKENAIGTIDNAGLLSSNGGLFTSRNIGTCTVFARMDGKNIAWSEVVVKCPCDKEADFEELIRLYKQRIPEGPYHRDLKAGNVSPPYSSMNPGYATNLYSAMNYTEYKEYTCGGYQGMALKFLHDIQSTPEECYLLNDYDFGPMEGSYSAHHAVVVYPKGTDWKKTGMVFDPWYHQKPEVMSINVWDDVFSPIAGDTSPNYRHKYNTTKDPNDYKYAAWTAAGDLVQDTVDLAQDAAVLVGFGQCPVNILITDSSGRQMGAISDDEMVFDIPNAFITRMSDEDGGYQWYFTLPTTDEYDVDITAFDDGDFEFIVANSNTEQLQMYGEHPIKKGENAEVELSSEDPTIPMILPDKSEVIPIQEELVVPEMPDKSDNPSMVKEKGLPGFELWIATFVIFLIMLVRRS